MNGNALKNLGKLNDSLCIVASFHIYINVKLVLINKYSAFKHIVSTMSIASRLITDKSIKSLIKYNIYFVLMLLHTILQVLEAGIKS